MDDIITIGCCGLAFMLFGAALVRYGIGLGQKLTIAAQNDLPIDKKMPEYLQEATE
jgi:hypothetical protein